MPTTFYGKWSLDVTGNVGEFGQRVRIQGSLNADGDLAAAAGTQIPEIDGAAWEVFLERSNDAGATWQENLVQRIPTVTPQNGLTVTLYGDDSAVPPQESDVTVQFVYLNRQVNPQPVPPPFSFTLPPSSFWPRRPPLLCECCCKAPCCSRPRVPTGKYKICCWVCVSATEAERTGERQTVTLWRAGVEVASSILAMPRQISGRLDNLSGWSQYLRTQVRCFRYFGASGTMGAEPHDGSAPS